MTSFRIEPLGDHNRASFSCGVAALDHYLKAVATQDIRRSLATCFVAIDPDARAVAGFYTLSATSIEIEEYPEKKNVGRYSRVPAAPLTTGMMPSNPGAIRRDEILAHQPLRQRCGLLRPKQSVFGGTFSGYSSISMLVAESV